MTLEDVIEQTGTTELIDTLWNVNDDVSAFIAVKHLRINRYIMECKYTDITVDCGGFV